MKKLVVAFFLSTLPFLASTQITDFTAFFNRTDGFLQEYVSFGRVDYARINSSELDSLIDFIAAADFERQSLVIKKAFLINAYNLLVVHQVKRQYPIDSPRTIPGFFEENTFQVGGEEITLNALENDVLRKKYPDPRYHFVLVCGAIDCPPLDNKAFRPERLESHLEERTRKAMKNESFIYEVDGTVFLSQIFEWYSSDFGRNIKEVLAYINNFRATPFSASKVEYYQYNWQLNDVLQETQGSNQEVNSLSDEPFNLQTFTAGSLLGKGQMDYTMFNTVYTQTRGNWLGSTFSGFRETFMTSLWQFSIGVDKNKRINVGLDLNFKASAISSDSTVASVTAPFAFANTDTTRVGLTSVGLRAKVAPFKAVKDLSIQTTVYIPTVRDPEGVSTTENLYWADWDRITMWNQIFWTKTWKKFQLFTEIDALIRFKYRANQITHVDVPMTVIGSYFPTSKWTVYGIAQHNPRITYDLDQAGTDWVIPANYSSLGAGLKFQPISNLTLELLYTNFVRGVNSGLGATFNLGIKYITK